MQPPGNFYNRFRSIATSLLCAALGATCTEAPVLGVVAEGQLSPEAAESADPVALVSASLAGTATVDAPRDGDSQEADDLEVRVTLTKATVELERYELVASEKEIGMCLLDITWPEGTEAVEKRTVTIEVEAHDAGYELTILRVYLLEDQLTFVSRLERSIELFTESIPQRITDHIAVKAPDLEIAHVVVGERPERAFNDALEFVDELAEAEERFEGAQLLYQAD